MKAIAKLKDDARRYELREEWDRAIDAYLQVLRIAEEGDGADLDLPLYNRVGDLFVRLNRPMDAVTYYEQAADRYAEAGLFNNAIALCNKALRYDSGRLPLLRKLGSFSASQGFFTDARRWYLEFAEKSIKRGAMDDAFSALADLANVSDDPDVRELLAHQLREHGRTADAITEYKRAHALRLAAGQPEHAAAIAAKLQQLDPNVDLSVSAMPAPVHESPSWQNAEQLPGYADVELPPVADALPLVAEPSAMELPTLEELPTLAEELPQFVEDVQPLTELPQFEDEVPGAAEERPSLVEELVDERPALAESSVSEVEPTLEAPAFEAEPTFEEAPAFEAEPTFEEAPAFEAEPTSEEAPAFDAEPTFEEAPAFEAEPTFEEAPAFEAEPTIEDAPAFESEPTFAAEPKFAEEPATEEDLPLISDEPASFAAEASAANDVAREPLEFESELIDLESEMLDLRRVSFDNFGKTAEPATADTAGVFDVPVDVGPMDVEVEEHELLNLSELRIDPETSEDVEAVEPLAGFEEYGIEMEINELEYPTFDIRPDEEAADTVEEYDADVPSFPTYEHVEPGSISSFDESEFGDYITEPPRRVFDFEEDADTQPEGRLADDIEEALDDALRGQPEDGIDPVQLESEPLLELHTESALEPEVESARELEIESFAEVEFEPPAAITAEPFEHIEATSFEPAEAVSFDQTEAESVDQIEAEPFARDQVESFEDVEPELLLEAGTLPDFEMQFDAGYAGDSEPDLGMHAESGFADELSSSTEFDAAVAPSPQPPLAPRRPVADYVDLAAFLDERDEEQAEESTRFVVAEMPPTGDEEKDFADMLQQFKQKVAQSIPKEDAGSHYDLGIAFKEMGLVDEAIGEFQTALRSGQEKLKVYEELGSCFMLKQQYSIAITVLSRAQQMEHKDETELLGVYYNLGRAHEELGQRAEARAAFEKILAVDIGFQDTTQRLARL